MTTPSGVSPTATTTPDGGVVVAGAVSGSAAVRDGTGRGALEPQPASDANVRDAVSASPTVRIP